MTISGKENIMSKIKAITVDANALLGVSVSVTRDDGKRRDYWVKPDSCTAAIRAQVKVDSRDGKKTN